MTTRRSDSSGVIASHLLHYTITTTPTITSTTRMWTRRRKLLSNRPRGASKRGARALAKVPLLLLLIAAFWSVLCISFLVIRRNMSITEDSTSTSSATTGLRRAKNEENDSQQQDDDDWPLIHIVNTRFMQEQGHFVTLAQARLHLFETFCLPTMIHQTSQHFLWIIKTDPLLDTHIRNHLVALLQPYPNYYLVGSNHNYGTADDGSWRDGSEGRNVLESNIYTGNMDWLKQAHLLREERPILETRLDADDGIHKLYLQYVQYSASKYMMHHKWLYWCSRRHVEWYASPKKLRGLVNPVQHEKLCITPGITVGYSVGIMTVPQYDHDVLYKEIQAHGGCHDDNQESHDNMDCIQLVNDLSFVAVRSRTPTSAGMKDIDLQEEILNQEGVNMMWKALEKLFFVSPEKAIQTNQFVLDNLPQIAKENLEGQCTTGHSCKNSSIVILQKLMKDGEDLGV